MSKKVLVIDDDRTTTTLVSFLLKSNNIQAMVASDGEEGLARVKAEQPDLIILDVEMPKLDGYSFLNELKSSDHGRIPVMMLTSKESMRDLFRMEGVVDYFIKPIDSGKFLKRIREFF